MAPQQVFTNDEIYNFIAEEWTHANKVYGGALGLLPEIKFSRAAKTNGRCFTAYNEGERYVSALEFTRFMVSEHDYRDCARHEIAHAAAWILDGYRGHGFIWKQHALKIGASPTRCNARKKVEGAGNQKRNPYATVRCPAPTCDNEATFWRAGKKVRAILEQKRGYYLCRKCGEKMTDITLHRHA